MKQLLLIRHGKSDWRSLSTTDFGRPLNHRGNKNAPVMAKRILERGFAPQYLVSSPAVRAFSTAKHFAKIWGFVPNDIRLEEPVYEADKEALLTLVNNFKNNFNRIAVFGHNPGMTDFANYLCDAGISNIPTTGVVIIDFDADDWAEISYHTGTMLSFDFPKNTDEPH